MKIYSHLRMLLTIFVLFQKVVIVFRYVLLCFLLSVWSWSENTKVAVMPFAGGEGQSELTFLSKVLADAFGSALANQEKVTLVERQQLKTFLQNHQIEDALTNESLSEDLAAADLILVGSYGGNSQSLHVEARLIQSGSAKVMATQTIHAAMEEVFRQIPPTATRLFKKALGREIGALNVNSIPLGAKVFLDGVEIGFTPLLVAQIPTGPHSLKITRAKSQSCEREILIQKGDTARIQCELKSDLDQWHLGLRMGGVLSNLQLDGHESGSQGNLSTAFSLRYLTFGLQVAYMGPNLGTYSNYQYDYKIPSELLDTRTQTRKLSLSQVSADGQLYPLIHCRDFCPYIGLGGGLMTIQSQADDTLYHSSHFEPQSFWTSNLHVGIELFPHSIVGLYFAAQGTKVWAFNEEQLESVNFRGKPTWKNQPMNLWLSGLQAGIRLGVGL